MSTLPYRLQFILDQIEQKGSVNVLDLAENLSVSDMTIRRDLRELESIGLIRRFHGGAVSSRGRAYEPPLFTRKIENQTQKEMIGKFAANMVVEGDCIALDVGSTTYQIALNLTKTKNITIVTPSLQIASVFFDRTDIRLIIPGGIVRPVENSLIGDIARWNLGQFYYDRLFLAAGAIDLSSGITEYNIDDAMIKKAMIKNAKEVVLVADSSKFQRTTFSFVADLNEINHLITDDTPPKDLMAHLKSHGISIHIVNKIGEQPTKYRGDRDVVD